MYAVCVSGLPLHMIEYKIVTIYYNTLHFLHAMQLGIYIYIRSSTMPNITCACILVVILPRRPTTLASFPRAAWHSSSHHQDTVSMWRGIPHVWLRFESVQAVWLRHSIYTSSKIGGHTADIMLECDYFGDIFSQLPPRVCPANLAFTEGSFPSLLTATVIQTLVEFQGHCWVPVSCNEVFEKLDFSCTNGYELLASALCVYLLSAYPNSFAADFWRFYISHWQAMLQVTDSISCV